MLIESTPQPTIDILAQLEAIYAERADIPTLFTWGLYIPDEIVRNIFNKVEKFRDGLSCCCVCKKMYKIANEKLFIFKTFGFSPLAWNKYCSENNEKTVANVEIDEAYRTFPDIRDRLLSPSPLDKMKKRAETDILFYIPEQIYNTCKTLALETRTIHSNLTISNLNNFIPYKYIWSQFNVLYGKEKITPGWVLMGTDILPDSTNLSYEVQKAKVEALNISPETQFQVPTTGEVICGMMVERRKTRRKLLPKVTTRCQEAIGEDHPAVGYFGLNGPVIQYSPDNSLTGILYLERL